MLANCSELREGCAGWEVFVIVLAVVVGVVLIGSIGLIIWKKRSRRATFVK